MLGKLLFLATLVLSLEDWSLERYELGLHGMSAFVALFCAPGSDHKKASHR